MKRIQNCKRKKEIHFPKFTLEMPNDKDGKQSDMSINFEFYNPKLYIEFNFAITRRGLIKKKENKGRH
jgi:hypothetical protein